MECVEISYSEFEIDVEMPLYLSKATADVWYDLLGTFFIYSVEEEIFVTTIHIKDNSDKYSEIAKFLYSYIHNSKDFLLFTPLSEYQNYFIFENGKLRQISQASKQADRIPSVFDPKEILSRTEHLENDFCVNYGMVPCSDFSVMYLSWLSVSFMDSFYIFNSITKQLFLVDEFDPYDSTESQISHRIKGFDVINATEYLTVFNTVKYAEIYKVNNSKVEKLIG